MKKLMLALAAVSMTVVASASTFSWGLNSGSFDTTKFENATAYLFYSTGTTLSLPDTSTWSTKTSFSESDVKSSNATKLTTADISNGLFDGTTVASAYGSLVPADLGLSSQKSVKFYMAVISDDGQHVTIVDSTKSAMIANSATAAAAKWSTTNLAVYVAVPEPTSGLLLLLGMAGLALRRRRA